MVNVTMTGILKRPVTFRVTTKELLEMMAWYEGWWHTEGRLKYFIRPVE